MELRHLRCFLAVAEELHFARAAERLHIDQSPLSRTIKELEEELGARLFVRTTRSTQLTRAGRLFLEHVQRVFTVLEQARDSVKSAANGFCGQLRIALSDGVTPSRLPALLARSREEDPEVEIRLFEVPLDQQIKGKRPAKRPLGPCEVVDFPRVHRRAVSESFSVGKRRIRLSLLWTWRCNSASSCTQLRKANSAGSFSRIGL